MTAAEKSVIHMLTSYGKLMKLNSISKPKEYEYDSIYHFILENINPESILRIFFAQISKFYNKLIC